jgi:hypothetical protein
VRALDDTTELFSLLLDGVTPEAKLLLTIEGPIATVTATPADAGILFTRTGHAPDDTLMFAPFEPTGTLGTPALVVEGPWSYEIQPWP